MQHFDVNISDPKNAKRSDVHMDILNSMHSFTNTNNCCWANATLQCIININAFHNAIMLGQSNMLKTIFLQYGNPLAGTLDLITLRREFNGEFQMGQQHDATEFTRALMDKFPVLGTKCTFSTIYYEKCVQNCELSRGRHPQRNTTSCILHLPANRSCSLQELIEFNFDRWINIEGVFCKNPSCRQQMIQTRKIEDPKDVIIFELQLATNIRNQKITNFQLKSVPQTVLNICNKSYVLAGAIFHHGDFLVHPSNHYTAILRKENTFFKANDSNISKCNWPRNSRDLYMLFYIERTNN